MHCERLLAKATNSSLKQGTICCGRTGRYVGRHGPGGTRLAADAMDRIIADIVTLCSLRLDRIRPEIAPEHATRLGRAAIDDARPFLSLPVTMSDDALVVPVSTDGTCVVRILSH
jgi:hypothetical protein